MIIPQPLSPQSVNYQLSSSNDQLCPLFIKYIPCLIKTYVCQCVFKTSTLRKLKTKLFQLLLNKCYWFQQASSAENPALNPMISALEDELIYRSYGNMSTVTDPVHLQQLLPYDHQKFFRYHGSMTTPPCSEVVIWTVMEHVSYISKSQVIMNYILFRN